MGVELRVLSCCASALLLLTGCSAGPPTATVRERPAGQGAMSAMARAVRAEVLPADDPYAQSVHAAHDRGLEVWLSADLVRRYQEGPTSLRRAVARLAALAALPGVAGVKIADELGKDDGLDTPAQTLAFAGAVSALLRASLPGTRIMVDLYVPQLGCGPDLQAAAERREACARESAAEYPSLTLPAVDALLRSGTIDVVNLSTGLRDDTTYATWGLTPQQVQQAAWQTVRSRGWDRSVTLQARKALAHEGPYLDSSAHAMRDVQLFVGTPLSQGAQAVDVWTWRQNYRGGVYRLADPGPVSNALWQQLIARHDAGDKLLTHFTPSSIEQGIEADMDFIAQAFRGVLIAAGTG